MARSLKQPWTGPRAGRNSVDPSPSLRSLPSHRGSIYSPLTRTLGFALDAKEVEDLPLTELSLDSYVLCRGGKNVIKKILVANNGIAAVKGIRSIRRWCYETFGDENVVEFVAMATPEDLNSNAEYIRLADEFEEVPGGSNNYNYANVMLIVDIAERKNVQAVWAGWGHASEDPELPDALRRAGITWIGPTPESMRALGDKIASTIIAQSASVACMPWSGSGIMLDDPKSSKIPPELYKKACINTHEEAIKSAEKIGYPVMIKASEGGGGKGIRMVTKAEDVKIAFGQVQGEAPGSPIFLMKLASNARHLEVQVLGDETGQAIALYGRDCSIQRRHQKIIEEGPVTEDACNPETWKEMERAAVRLCSRVGYVGAGTVEYLYLDDGSYCFLELNPRLQVEHPVTELISGVNLPAAQLQIAMGIPLHRNPEIRRMFDENTYFHSKIDFENVEPVAPTTHVIACRITAENPDSDFQPTSGAIHQLNFRTTPDVWGYFSVDSNGGVHEYADSQFGHLFAVGNTREAARKNMVVALSELFIRGEIRTTVEYLRRILETEEYVQNMISTTWLEDTMKSGLMTEKPDPHIVTVCGALVRGHTLAEERYAYYMDCLDRGRFLTTKADHEILLNFNIELIYDGIKYVFRVTKAGQNIYDVHLGDWMCTTNVHPLSGGGMLVTLDNKSYSVYGLETHSGLRLTINGKTCLFSQEYDPSTLTTAMPGKLVRFLVADNDHLAKGEPYAEMEVMKMYIPLVAPESGKIRVSVPEGAVLQAGDVVANLELDEPGRVKKAKLFGGKFPHLAAHSGNTKSHLSLRQSCERLNNLLDGYTIGQDNIAIYVEQLMSALRDPKLPVYDFLETVSTLNGRIPDVLFKRFKEVSQEYLDHVSSHRFYWETPRAFPTFEFLNEIDNCKNHMDEAEQTKLTLSLEGVTSLLHKYRGGNHNYAVNLIIQFIKKYLAVENKFSGRRHELVISDLRKQYRNELEKVHSLCLAHFHKHERNLLMAALLDTIESQLTPLMPKFINCLKNAAKLIGQDYAVVVLRARKILMKETVPSINIRRIQVESILSTINQIRNGSFVDLDEEERASRLAPLINESQEISDVLFTFFSTHPPRIQAGALEVYIRRVFRTYRIKNLDIDQQKGHFIRAHWDYYQASQANESEFIHVNSWDKQRSAHTPKANGSPTKASRNRGLVPSPISVVQSPITSSSWTPKSSASQNSPNKLKRMGGGGGGSGGGGWTSNFRNESYTNLAALTRAEPLHEEDIKDETVHRRGLMSFFADFNGLKEYFPELLALFKPVIFGGDFQNTVHIGFFWSVSSLGKLPDDNHFTESFRNVIQSNREALVEKHIRNVCFIVSNGTDFPLYFTYRYRLDYKEDQIIRHIEPPMAAHLEISRLSNFEIRFLSAKNRMVHLFEAKPKDTSFYEKNRRSRYDGRRFYARVLIRQVDSLAINIEQQKQTGELDLDAFPEPEQAFVEALNALEAAIDGKYHQWRYNHVYMSCLVDAVIDVTFVKAVIRNLTHRYEYTVKRLNITQVEIRLDIRSHPDAPVTPIRFVCSNPTGHVLEVLSYTESRDNDDGQLYFHYNHDDEDAKEADWDRKPVLTPYPDHEPFQNEREIAARNNTIYVYDILRLFEKSLQNIWLKTAHDKEKDESIEIPQNQLDFIELVLGENNKLDEVKRIGGNQIGMVAWKLTLKTPEFPSGREIVVIANDITYSVGTFGTEEDLLYYRASEYARERGLPRLYIAANSGARIGLATELLSCFQVAQKASSNPTEGGIEYLYVTEDDYKNLELADSIKGERIVIKNEDQPEEVRYKITDIIGKQHGLNVENLSGSGMIAGETSLAYDEIFTLSYVTGRTVGIGAYLVRLGQRVIQKENSPIILTGHNALNKVLGKEVYTSNQQLGGIDIMVPSGVTHLKVKTDLEGISACLKWLSYVPKTRGAVSTVPQTMCPADSVDREIEISPKKESHDPRQFLQGDYGADGEWISGFFDKGSFVELLHVWAQTVVVGRARLGGLPIGVIVVETRSVEAVIPADPAAPESKEQVLSQAGQVWYPDSAYKTAQAIKDMNGEDLPLMIFANWRGFSGGMRDMYAEILKFGAQIVDALRTYSQPVFVYIPPHGELRGGAWVVVDTTINPQYMEMYAAEKARGGVLEPAGTIDVKFKKPEQLRHAHRLDAELIRLDEMKKQLTAEQKEQERGKEDSSSESEETLVEMKNNIKKLGLQIKQREKKVLPYYQQVALAFVDLHDTPGRMKEKKVIKQVVPWKNARRFFYWRLRRRLLECQLVKRIQDAHSNLEWEQALRMVQDCLPEESSEGKHEMETPEISDKDFVARFLKNDDKFERIIKDCETKTLQSDMTNLIERHPSGVVAGLISIFESLNSEQTEFLKQSLLKNESGDK